VTDQTPAEVSGDESRNRHREMFQEGAPDVAISGVDVWRATITRSDGQQGNEASRSEDATHWHVSGFPMGSKDYSLVLVGDLTCAAGGWFVGVTSTCMLLFRHPNQIDPDDLAEVNAATRRLAPWAANVLYDTAAARARSLVAASASCAIEVPLLTPVTHVTQIAPPPEQDDAAARESGSSE
jgi:hypothetical protein